MKWHPALNYASDQTGISHLLKQDAKTEKTLCGAKPRQIGGGFDTAEETGTRECPQCRKIHEKMVKS